MQQANIPGTIIKFTANYIEGREVYTMTDGADLPNSSEVWWENDGSTSNSMWRKADGAIRRMVYLKGVFSQPCYSMSIQTTSLYTMRHAASSISSFAWLTRLQWYRQTYGAGRRTLSRNSAILRQETQNEMNMDRKLNNNNTTQIHLCWRPVYSHTT